MKAAAKGEEQETADKVVPNDLDGKQDHESEKELEIVLKKPRAETKLESLPLPPSWPFTVLQGPPLLKQSPPPKKQAKLWKADFNLHFSSPNIVWESLNSKGLAALIIDYKGYWPVSSIGATIKDVGGSSNSDSRCIGDMQRGNTKGITAQHNEGNKTSDR
ncbi:hypothetical protein B0H14DRAFT_2647765 [Mycena olivaceomarginata]|nr:hypothetical protein B0H14DRAFT_2647765 [Mycena olivaceomarginata]